MKIELLIFDCDGVLVDSEIIAHKVVVQEICCFDGSMTVEKSVKLFTGVSDDEIAKILKKRYNEKLTDNFLRELRNKIVTNLQNELKPIPNIHNVMQYVSEKKMQRCIASNSMPEHLFSVLNATELNNYFNRDRVYNISLVRYGKPKPDLFLYAADKMKVKPKNCLVIEDSFLGIAAAKAAKMPVIGFLGGTHAKYSWYKNLIQKAKPKIIAADALDLLDILKKLK